MKKIYLLTLVLFISILGYSQSIFLEIKNVQGDTPDGQPVLAYSWGVSNSGSSHLGGGMGAGKANVQDLSFTMLSGKPSLLLLRSATLGTHFPEMKLKIMDGKKLVYSITLYEVMVSSFQQGASCGTAKCDQPGENIALNFARFKVEDFTQNTSFDFNVASNTQN
jgi:type VI secretion system secreted protein Hcp